MKNLTFEKYGLSPEKVEQLRAYKILPDKQTLKNLIKAYKTDKAEETEIADFQRELSQPIDEEYIRFLLEHNGGIPSKNRVKGSKVVIDEIYPCVPVAAAGVGIGYGLDNPADSDRAPQPTQNPDRLILPIGVCGGPSWDRTSDLSGVNGTLFH